MKNLKNNIDLYNDQWLIMTDLDGTFLANTPNFAIPALNVKAVKKLNQLGHKFVLATGRSPQLVHFNHSYLELDTPMILFHGALIVADEKHPELALIDNSISAKDIKEILTDINFFGTAKSIHAIGINKSLEINTIEDLDILDFDVYELVVMYKDKDKMNRENVLSKMDKYPNVDFKYIGGMAGIPEDLYLFMARNTDKLHAVKKVAEYYNIPRERVMFFGDNTNDLEAVKWAGVGVAVGNSKEELKEVADFVINEVNDKGAVGKFIFELLEK